jgi:hypothetical protein
MPVKVIIESVKSINDSIWSADLDHADLAVLSTAKSKIGKMNILYLPQTEKPHSGSEELLLDPRDIIFLNSGASSKAILIFGEKVENSRDQKKSSNYFGNDELFSKEMLQLSKPLQDLGNELVNRIRQIFPGYFIKSKNGRYVNQPDNFWTIKIQPNDQSFAITVRGKSFEFRNIDDIKILDDRPGFSRFKIEDYRQLESAIKIISKSGNR